MDCLELRKNLLLYLVCELPPDEAQAIRRHLDACPSCRRRANYEERFQRVLRERLAPHPAPPGLRDRICARLDEEQAGRRWGAGRLIALRPALVGGLAAIGVLLVLAPFLTGRILNRGEGRGTPATLRGRLVCVQCERKGAPIASQRSCRAIGHATGLKTGDGRILRFVNNESAALLSDPALRGREVEVAGTLYRKISTLEVGGHTLL